MPPTDEHSGVAGHPKECSIPPNPALVCRWRDSRETCTDQPVLEAVGLIEDAVRRRAAGDLGQ
jgi:hypothetical protein